MVVGVSESFVVRTLDEIQRLDDEWEDLYSRSPAASPYQSYGWVASYLKAYRGREQPHIVAIRRNGSLVALAPLTLRRNRGIAFLAPVASQISDFSGILLDSKAVDSVGLLARTLLQVPSWHAVDFPEVPPGSAVWALMKEWPGYALDVSSSPCPEIRSDSFEQFLQVLGRDERRRVRKKARQLDAARISVDVAPAHSAAASVHRMLALHYRQWQGRGMNPEHGTREFIEHLASAANIMVRRSQAAVVDYSVEDRVILSAFVVLGHDFVGQYLYGHDPEARHFDGQVMQARGGLELAAQLGLRRLSMQRGASDEKLRLAQEVRHNRRLVLTRPGTVRGRFYSAAVAGRQAAVDYTRSHSAVYHAVSRVHARLVDHRD